MNVWNKLKLAVGRKALKEFRWVYLHDKSIPTFINADKESFAREGYSSNVYVYSVIKQIATKCSSIQWTLYKVTDEKSFWKYRIKNKSLGRMHKDTREMRSKAMEEVSHPQIEQVLEQPNEIQTWSEFVESVISFKEIAGDSFIVGFGPTTGENTGKFLELVPIPAHQVTVLVGQYPRRPVGYELEGMRVTIPPEQVIHMKYFNPLEPYIGLSPMEAALYQVTQSNNYSKWNVSLTQNMGKIPGILEIKVDHITEEQEQQIIAKYRERQSGGDKAGTPFISSNEVKWHPTAFSPHDMDWLRGVQLTANQIALAYDWPPELVGDSSQKTHANMRDAIRHAYNAKIIPSMDSLRDSLNKYWIDSWRTEGVHYYIDYNLENIEALQADRAEQSERVVREWTAGLRTLNESRWELGLEEVDDGDVRQIPMGLLGVQDWEQEADKAVQKLKEAGLYEYGENGQ
jgi:HK97 family phage portal protein